MYNILLNSLLMVLVIRSICFITTNAMIAYKIRKISSPALIIGKKFMSNPAISVVIFVLTIFIAFNQIGQFVVYKAWFWYRMKFKLRLFCSSLHEYIAVVK